MREDQYLASQEGGRRLQASLNAAIIGRMFSSIAVVEGGGVSIDVVVRDGLSLVLLLLLLWCWCW